jgi:hypothetical protein
LLEQNAVDDGFNGVVLAAVEQKRFGKVADFAIDASAKALLVKLIEQFFKLTFAASDNGGHDVDAFSLAELKDAGNDLVGGLAGDGSTAIGAVRRADRGIKQAQIVVNLGNGSTVERGLRLVVFCSMEMAGDRPSMESTSGRSIWSRNWRA